MKTFKYILVLCIMVTAMACDRSDDSNFDVLLPDKPSFDESTVYGKRMKEFFDKYGINIMFLLMICFIRGPEVRTGHQVLLIMNTRRLMPNTSLRLWISWRMK